MQLLVCLWIVLCLVVDTSTKSVTSSDDETGIGDNPDSLQWKADGNQTAEQCKCENGFCKEDDTGKSVCTCPPEWGLYDSTECRKCNCGKNSNCTFERMWMYFEKVKCICEVGYEVTGDFCIGTCRKNPCHNGGSCKVKGKDIECRCLLSYTGERCEKEVWCNDTEGCQNGGRCKKIFDKKYCLCKPGTEGPYCQIVPKCSNMNCGTDAKCVYDIQSVKAVCQCKDDSLSFDAVDERCKMRCNETHVCKNGGVCLRTGDDSFCRCRNGTGGDFCSIVSECIEKNCGRDAECVYDVLSETAVCQCRDERLSLDPVDERCKMTCNESEECKNGGWCSNTTRDCFCRCRTGTLGDFCNIVPECRNKNCGKDAECVYEVQSEKAVCQCRDDRLSFDPDDKICKHVCLPNSCLNDGICNATDEGVTCQCKDRFRGPDCSIDICSPNPCLNGGVCNATREGVICHCTNRFRGDDCSIEIPFLSTSTSVETSSSTPNSTILPTNHPTSSPSDYSQNFTVGTESTRPFPTFLPTTDIGPCTENPCQNGGACVVVGNWPKCLCKKPYLGYLCETDPCDLNPCKNGGVCRIEGEAFRCYCKMPFTGKLCESQTDPCDSNPCKNGGVCKAKNETVKCYCKEPFVGEFCESRTKIDTYVITLDAFTMFLAIVLVFVICVVCLRYQAIRSS